MKKALFIGFFSIVVVFWTAMTAKAVTVEQAVNTILECGLKEGLELYEFRLQDDGLLISKSGDRYIQNVSVTQSDEIQFDLITPPASVVNSTLTRHGIWWGDSANKLTLGGLCMHPLEQ